MLNVICFGASSGGINLYDKISEKYNILAYTDNDKSKWGEKINEINILSINDSLKLNFDRIIITSAPGLESIKKQLIDCGIEKSIIDDSFVIAPLESRRIFLERLSIMQKDCITQNSQVAEVGVFEGDFARYINLYYPNQKLYLFDTFEGFSQNDIIHEEGLSYAKTGDYSNTTVDIVMNKMPYPKMINIRKGYFPETTKNIGGEFCFVNLDVDLYLPTYNGLVFFKDKMMNNGVILVHDYFATNFKGPKKAVDRFIYENPQYNIYPIGDGISVMIVGF